jgi:hypothetical protein
MQKAESQHNHEQHQPSARQGKGMALDSPKGERIAQLEAMVESSPQAGKLAQLAAMVDSSPAMAAQRKLIGPAHNSPAMAAQREAVARLAPSVHAFQFKVDSALFAFDDEKDGEETPTKIVNTKTMGGPFAYKFSKDGAVIDSFETNIAKPQAFKGGTVQPGPSPVVHAVDILDTSLTTVEEIAEDSRPKHFRAADKLADLGKGARTNKLTWHHKLTPCKLETVDMNVHGVMSHYGGFSQWKGADVAEDDDG